jgi:mannose/fructose/N-acetylgalactosamine-specific phosphotransferase system component IIB
VPVESFRIDDRLIHGQVVVGWGQPLGLRFIVLVDDEVAVSDWEQDLYRMGVPPEMEVFFESVDEAIRALPGHQADSRRGILLTRDISTMARIIDGGGEVSRITVGGLHHRSGRTGRLRYVFVTPGEEAELRKLAGAGVRIVAQDLPNARAVALDDFLDAGQGE